MNKELISVIQIILSILLIALILIQAKGTGLGSTFGADMGFYRTKRGAEKMFFYMTIAVSALFIIATIVGLIV